MSIPATSRTRIKHAISRLEGEDSSAPPTKLTTPMMSFTHIGCVYDCKRYTAHAWRPGRAYPEERRRLRRVGILECVRGILRQHKGENLTPCRNAELVQHLPGFVRSQLLRTTTPSLRAAMKAGVIPSYVALCACTKKSSQLQHMVQERGLRTSKTIISLGLRGPTWTRASKLLFVGISEKCKRKVTRENLSLKTPDVDLIIHCKWGRLPM